jgi:uncharacterized protein (DUF1499 family)
MTSTTQPGRLLRWAGYLAALCLLLLPVSVLVVRSGLWREGLLLYAVACLVGTALLAVFILLFLLPRYAGLRGGIARRAALALVPALLFTSLAAGRGDYPPIHDITTDTTEPPTFEAAAALRGVDSNPLTIDPETIAQQQAAYPDLTTVNSPLPVDAAFARAVATAQGLGWKVHHQDPQEGRIEAVATTTIMGFRDDVVIRLRAVPKGTSVDLRSVSRVGVSDLGANARRIRDFQQAFQASGQAD